MIRDVIEKDIKIYPGIDAEALRNVTTYSEYVSFMTSYLSLKHPFCTYVTDNIEYTLIRECELYLSLKCSIRYKGDSFKVYPYEPTIKQRKDYYHNVLEAIVKYHYESGIDFENAIKEYINLYIEENKNIKEDLKKRKMLPYYGNVQFMLHKAGYTLRCAKDLVGETVSMDALLEMKAFLEKYPEIPEDYRDVYPYYSDDFKDDYDAFEKNYLSILELEKTLEPLAKKRWKDFLTDPNDYDPNHFAYLAHTFTAGSVSPNEIHKVCTSLLTDKIQTSGEFGLLFGADNNFDECCSCDAGSWELTKSEFIDRNLPKNWQYPSTDELTVFYEEPEVSKLLIPERIEQDVLDNNMATYSEIVITGTPKPIAVFYNDYCENVEMVKMYAEKCGLPLVHVTRRGERAWWKTC